MRVAKGLQNFVESVPAVDSCELLNELCWGKRPSVDSAHLRQQHRRQRRQQRRRQRRQQHRRQRRQKRRQQRRQKRR
jgi:hypothetical protein